MQYSVFPGWHATALIPTFFSSGFTADTASWLDDVAMFFAPALAPFVAGISAAMQSYFASFITTGNPNLKRALWNLPPTVHWSHPNCNGSQSRGVVNVGDWGFTTISDSQNQRMQCDFWKSFATTVTALGGYSPPGAGVVG